MRRSLLIPLIPLFIHQLILRVVDLAGSGVSRGLRAQLGV